MGYLGSCGRKEGWGVAAPLLPKANPTQRAQPVVRGQRQTQRSTVNTGSERQSVPGAGQIAPPPPGDALRVMHVVFTFHPGGMELGVLKLVNGLDPHRI